MYLHFDQHLRTLGGTSSLLPTSDITMYGLSEPLTCVSGILE